jgi:hypothetical protein
MITAGGGAGAGSGTTMTVVLVPGLPAAPVSPGGPGGPGTGTGTGTWVVVGVGGTTTVRSQAVSANSINSDAGMAIFLIVELLEWMELSTYRAWHAKCRANCAIACRRAARSAVAARLRGAGGALRLHSCNT